MGIFQALFICLQGDYSIRVERQSDSVIQAEALEVLQNMYPSVDIPEPIDFYFPRWHTDPLFRGSYSNWPASFVSEHHDNLRANVGSRLWFAGEATSRRYFGKCSMTLLHHEAS
jgi:polyamine oxidase